MAKNIAKTAKAPAPAKKAEKKEGVSTAWNLGKTMTLHSVKVGGKSYRSVWAAFEALGMGEKSGVSRGRHIKFRAALKKLGVGKSLDFTDPRPKGKTFRFTLEKPATPA